MCSTRHFMPPVMLWCGSMYATRSFRIGVRPPCLYSVPALGSGPCTPEYNAERPWSLAALEDAQFAARDAHSCHDLQRQQPPRQQHAARLAAYVRRGGPTCWKLRKLRCSRKSTRSAGRYCGSPGAGPRSPSSHPGGHPQPDDRQGACQDLKRVAPWGRDDALCTCRSHSAARSALIFAICATSGECQVPQLFSRRRRCIRTNAVMCSGMTHHTYQCFPPRTTQGPIIICSR